MSKVADMLGALVAVYPHPPADEKRTRAYVKALADLTDAECEIAFLTLSRQRDRKFFPSPGEILNAARPPLAGSALGEMYDGIELAVLIRRVTLDDIAEEFGYTAMLAAKAVGVENIKWQALSPDRVFRRMEFVAAFPTEEEALEQQRIAGPINERVAKLAESVGRQMALPRGDR